MAVRPGVVGVEAHAFNVAPSQKGELFLFIKQQRRDNLDKCLFCVVWGRFSECESFAF